METKQKYGIVMVGKTHTGKTTFANNLVKKYMALRF